jgi:small-conductance mechanosensitive channel
MDLLQTRFYNDTAATWLIALGITLTSYLALTVLKTLFLRNLATLARRTRTDWDDMLGSILGRTSRVFLFVVALLIGSRLLSLTDGADHALAYIAVIGTVLQLGFWGRGAILTLIARQVDRAREKDPGAATTMAAVAIVLQLVMWTVLLLMGLDNLGVEVAPLIAGLGVGGIAVALAVQNILGDLFASLSIVLDKPFVIGDFIVVGELAGNVEHVGLKTTRVRSLSGEQIIFSNSDLLSTRIRNFKRMWERRVVFRVGVIYQTERADIEQIPGMLRAAVEGREKARFDRAHFVAFGPSSLDFETVYFVKDPDYTVYMDTHQAVNLEILDRFRDAGISFAYPTQMIYVEGVGTAPNP